MKRGRITRKTRVKPVNRTRRAASFERAYGGEARVRWMHQQPSVISGRTPCVCSHVRNGGRGRKADACWTVPMLLTEEKEYHAIGKRAFEAKYGVSLDALALETEARWQAFSGAKS
jgi:hypothetical protein